jgi:hypothetical protein
MVFMGLRRITPEIFYYKTRKGREADLFSGQSCQSFLPRLEHFLGDIPESGQ